MQEGEPRMKAQYENYRYVGEICRLQNQSIVECRLPGSEISSVLAVSAKAVPSDPVCADGEVQYGGKVLLNIVYEDGERKVCRAERGVEFFHKAEHASITPSCFAKVSLCADTIRYRREGSGLYLSVIVRAEIAVHGNKQMEYLSDGEGLIAKKETLNVCKTLCISGKSEGEDEFETDYVGDILLHSEEAIVTRVTAKSGQIDIEGELVLHICALNGDDSVVSYERLLPFQMQIPSEEAYGQITAGARVQVCSAQLQAGTDEEKGRSKIVFSYLLAAECRIFSEEGFSVVTDAFCTDRELLLKKQTEGSRYLTNTAKCVERIGGTVALSTPLDGEVALQAALLPRVEIACKKGERGFEAEGVVLADLLVKNADGSYRSTKMSLPFVFPIAGAGEETEAEAIVCGLNVRRKKNGETEAEATLKVCLYAYERREWTYIAEADEGAPYAEEENAISVFLPVEGEDLWQVSKRLRCTPETVMKNNPNLEFPVKKGKKIYIYRKITENSQK